MNQGKLTPNTGRERESLSISGGFFSPSENSKPQASSQFRGDHAIQLMLIKLLYSN